MSTVVISLDLQGQDVEDQSSQFYRCWTETLQHLSSVMKDLNGKALYGRDLSDDSKVLLVIEKLTQDQAKEAIKPILSILGDQASTIVLPSSSIVSYPCHRVQQTTFYLPPEKFSAAQLDTSMQVTLGRLQRRCIVADYRCGEIPSEVVYKSQECKTWMVFTVWSKISQPLPPEEGGRPGDAEILAVKSVKDRTNSLQTMSTLGCEERNWKFEALEEHYSPPGTFEKCCLVM